MKYTSSLQSSERSLFLPRTTGELFSLPSLTLALFVVLSATSISSAQTIVDFNDLTGIDTTDNLLKADGLGVSDPSLSFTRSLDGNDYIYSITYTGVDYDSDTTNDTLTLDVRVAGLNGGSVVAPNVNNAITGSVVLGTNDVSVNPIFGGVDHSFTVNGNNMNAGESLVFTVENVSISGASDYAATFDGFNAFQINETAGTNHRVAIGVGTDLLVKRTVGNLNVAGDFGQTMILSSADNAFRNENFGIRLIDFDLTVLQNFVFDGSTSVDWSTVDNWSTGTAPNSAGSRVVFDGDNGTQTSADLAGASFTIGELQVSSPDSAVSIQSSAVSSVLTLSPSSIGLVMSDATKDFTLDGTTGEAWTLALGSSQTWNVDSADVEGDLVGDSGVTLDLGVNTLTSNIGAGRELSLAGVVSGTGGITKSGAGTMLLSGTNTYTGVTNVIAGTLQAGSTQAFGVNPAIKVSNGLLKLDGNSMTLGSFSGAGKNDGSAAVVNDNASAATLTVGGGDATGSFGGVIADGATGGALALIKTGTGIQTLSGTNLYTGSTTISAGTLQLDGAGTVGSGDIVNDGTLVINNTAVYDYTGAISGTGALTKSNTGILTLSEANTYTGTTTVSGGTLDLTGSITSALTVNDGATLSGAGSTTGLLTLGDGSGTGAIIDVTTGSFTSDGLTTNITGGPISVIFSGVGVVDVVNYGAGSGVFTGLTTDFTAASPLGGHGTAGTFSDDGSTISMDTGILANNVWIGTTDGTWEIGGSNSNWQNSSDSLFYENDLVVFNDTGISQPNITLNSSVLVGQMTFANTSGAYVINDNGGGETITLDTGVTSTATGDVTINTALVSDGNFSLTGTGTLTLGGNNTLTGDIANESSLVINQSGVSTYSGDISGTGDLTFSGAGTTTLSGINTYSGGTTVSGGTINLNTTGAFGTGPITLDGGLLYDNGGTITLTNDIIINGTVTAQASGAGNFEINGDISGSGTLNLGGDTPSSSVSFIDDLSGFTGTISHANENNKNNAIFVGTVDTTASFFTSGDAPSNRSVLFSSGATIGELSGTGGRLITNGLLTVVQNTDTTYAGYLQNSGSGMSLEKQGTGTLTVTGTATYTGSTTVTEGALVLHRSAIVGNTQYVVNAPATLEVFIDDGEELTLSNPFDLSGDGIFKKTGVDAHLHNSADSDIAMASGGFIHIAEGSWPFGGATPGSWVSNLADMQLDSGTSFEGRSTTIYVDVLSGSGTMGIGGQVANGGGLILGVDDGTGTFSGVIKNTDVNGAAFSLEKQGTGTQTFSGINTYTGNTTVSAGTLTLADGGRLTFAPTADTVSNQVLGTGTLNLDGEIFFDLSGAALADGHSWLIVDVTNLTETFGGTFSVNSSLGAFTNDAGVWTYVDGAYEWSFSQATGTLSLGLTTFGTWATAEGATLDPAANDDADSLVNLLEFAFGTNPNASDATALMVGGGSFTPGTPAVEVSYTPDLDVKARFVRRTDYLTAGITYTVQFSNDLSTWAAADDVDGGTAVIIPGTSASGDYEAVEIDYPLFLDDGKKAKFFRLSINSVATDDVSPE